MQISLCLSQISLPGFLKEMQTLTIYDISLLLTPFLGLLYNIDANNIYTRGHFFIIPIIIDTLLYFHCFAYMIINRKTIHRDKVFKSQPTSPPNS